MCTVAGSAKNPGKNARIIYARQEWVNSNFSDIGNRLMNLKFINSTYTYNIFYFISANTFKNVFENAAGWRYFGRLGKYESLAVVVSPHEAWRYRVEPESRRPGDRRALHPLRKAQAPICIPWKILQTSSGQTVVIHRFDRWRGSAIVVVQRSEFFRIERLCRLIAKLFVTWRRREGSQFFPVSFVNNGSDFFLLWQFLFVHQAVIYTDGSRFHQKHFAAEMESWKQFKVRLNYSRTFIFAPFAYRSGLYVYFF